MESLAILHEFLERTASAAAGRGEAGEPMPPQERPAAPDVPLLPLPEPGLLPDLPANFLELAELRTSQRTFTGDALSLQELSCLLWCSQGVKMPLPGGASMRNVPSAGARHPFETYLLVQRAEGLAPGFYRFLAFSHALQPCKDLEEDAKERFLAAFHSAQVVAGSAVTFVWAAEAGRTLHRYGTRGVRYLFLDAGHACQNLYLAAQAQGIGVCALGAFDDQALDAALKLDASQGRFAVYAAAAGKCGN